MFGLSVGNPVPSTPALDSHLCSGVKKTGWALGKLLNPSQIYLTSGMLLSGERAGYMPHISNTAYQHGISEKALLGHLPDFILHFPLFKN